jgi:hypothetical protein
MTSPWTTDVVADNVKSRPFPSRTGLAIGFGLSFDGRPVLHLAAQEANTINPLENRIDD